MTHINHSDQENHSPDIGIILLAAGSSSRMGRSKQMLEVDGEQLLQRTAKVALASNATKVMIVLGANEQAHRNSIQQLPVEICVNPLWQTGMGSSLKKGLQSLLELIPKLEAVIVMVCDQPKLTTIHVNQLIQTFKETDSPVVASYYANSAGVPALFDKSLFDELLSIENESGAKKIIQQHKELLTTIDFPQGAIDLDTPDDYQKFIGKKD